MAPKLSHHKVVIEGKERQGSDSKE
jgi:hypothetical protein